MADPTIKDVHALLVALCAHLGVPGHGRAPAASNGAPTVRGGTGEIASDHDLDGTYGNPVIKKDPPRWDIDTNGSFVGCAYSECPPEYLDVLASALDWRAGKDDEAGARGEKNPKGYPKSGRFARLDSARARGWAQRKRNGWTPAPAPTGGSEYDFGGSTGGPQDAGADDIPF